MLEKIKYDANGLVAALVQDYSTNEILMFAYMNEESLRITLEKGVMTYWSRSRNKLWIKGETSGNFQTVKEIRLDCDADAILFKVEQKGGACHMGYKSCFFRKKVDDRLVENGEVIFDPAQVYKS